jgi:predicted dehydrogenase
MQLDNGVLAGYQQCHFTPDAWRSYCIIGTEGRIENFDDRPGTAVVRLWNRFRFGYDPEGDDSWRAEPATGGHGGADHLILNEFFRYLREGGETDTSPIAARMAVAAGVAATQSVRSGGVPVDVPPLPADLV